ncbi:MAG: ribosomal-protein-alanine N-acetyltransferase [Ruminococcaceae bacterium]|nr:ribosomal-protein-alanine N-acetyltransferase [Oscillospiraceae bacterium]
MLMEIRQHKKEDLGAIAEIEKLSINPPWSYSAVCSFSECETSRILVAECDGIVAGYITYSVVLDEVQIANVAVHPEYRRKGIAEKLLTTLSESAKLDNMFIITLEVRQSNEPAINLYTKCGYTEVGKRKNYYKNPAEDAILMNLTL